MNEDMWQIVKNVVGRKIHLIHLILYLFEEEIDWNDCRLQFTFVGGTILFLKNASDGESLYANSSAWVDPFSGQQDEVNKEFIRKHGKWIPVDVSDIEPFNLLVGAIIIDIQPIFNKFGTFNGVEFSIGEQYLNFVVEWDECHIFWGKNNPTLLAHGNRVSSARL